MLLSKILENNFYDEEDINISGIAFNNQAVKKGYLFFAIVGNKFNGCDFIDEAIQKGAVSIIAPESYKKKINTNIPIIKVNNTRKALAFAASKFFIKKPKNILAVTGTNGKTSIAYFVKMLLEKFHVKAASVGTLGIIGNEKARLQNTTPDPITLHHSLSKFYDQSYNHVIIEASSHGLDQYRMDGFNINTGIFTNITRDHYDYHKNYENYERAKFRLFNEILKPSQTAIINADDPVYEKLYKLCRNRGLKIISVGFNGKTIKIISSEPSGMGQKIQIEYNKKKFKLFLPLSGFFQCQNVLLASAYLICLGYQPRKIFSYFPELTNVPGRMELIANCKNGAKIYVDYAHTPDALQNVLMVAKNYTKNKLYVVFGCGGDRDIEKRNQMGKIASKIADRVIVTDDNPRSEDPALIRKQIMENCNNVLEIAGRDKAIERSIKLLGNDDVLMIAGKGHETEQFIGSKVIDFDDKKITSKIIKNLNI